MKRLVLSILGAFFMLTLVLQLSAQTNDTKLYAVAFHADYCGACKAIAPKVSELAMKLDGEPVEFMKFDFSNDETKISTNSLA